MTYHPLEILHNYRLGSRQATTELQRSDQPALQIEFDVLKLVEDLKKQPEAVILTGTAGDGKTYLAYKIIEALGLDLNKVRDGQAKGDYQLGKAFIDLDLSARPLDDNRVVEIGSALEKPDQLTLLCANEGKLMQLREKLAELGSEILDKALIVNLSRRALLAPQAWQKILKGTLEGPVWEQGFELSPTSILTRNRALLQDPEVAERLRYYLLLPYLLGEPITVRETLSFLSYALCGGLELEEGDGSELTEKPISDPLSHLLFNNIFSEPGDYRHGGRAVPGEKLLWWLYRFDPADQASPDADLQLLTKLDSLGVEPPPELKYMWHNELVYKDDDDVLYRHRLERYMRYARRWYSLSSKAGFAAYFPFRHFQSYMQALNASASDLQEQVYTLLKGLNLLLSEGQVNDDDLRVFYLLTDGSRQGLTLFNPEFMIPGTGWRFGDRGRKKR